MIRNMEEKVKEQEQEIDQVSGLLCHACRVLDAHKATYKPKLHKWWKNHQESDRLAEAKQANRVAINAHIMEALKGVSNQEKIEHLEELLDKIEG